MYKISKRRRGKWHIQIAKIHAEVRDLPQYPHAIMHPQIAPKGACKKCDIVNVENLWKKPLETLISSNED